MADDAAHTPAGPGTDGDDAGTADGFAAHAESTVAADAGAPSSAAEAKSADGTEATGRKRSASAKKVRSRELVTVGAGADDGERAAALPSGDLTPEPSAWSAPRRELADDRPQWTFPAAGAAPQIDRSGVRRATPPSRRSRTRHRTVRRPTSTSPSFRSWRQPRPRS